jgi:hypothetical protein
MRFVTSFIIDSKHRANIPLPKKSSLRIPAYMVQKLWPKNGDFFNDFFGKFSNDHKFLPITFVYYMRDASSKALSIEVIWWVLKSIS